MDKYLCICGVSFKRKNDADLHEKMYENISKNSGLNYLTHKVLKMNWKGRIKEIILDIPWRSVFRIMGIYIIYMVLSSHFNLHLDFGESILLGIGLGFMV